MRIAISALFLSFSTIAFAQLSWSPQSDSRRSPNDPCTMIEHKISGANFYMMAATESDSRAYDKAFDDIPYLIKDVSEVCSKNGSCSACNRNLADLKEKAEQFQNSYDSPQTSVNRIKEKLSACSESHVNQLKEELKLQQKRIPTTQLNQKTDAVR